MIKRGDIVRPTEEMLEYEAGIRHGDKRRYSTYTPRSRLLVRESQIIRRRCSRKWCRKEIHYGELYAASKEPSSSLCLDHVEVVNG